MLCLCYKTIARPKRIGIAASLLFKLRISGQAVNKSCLAFNIPLGIIILGVAKTQIVEPI
jgi:hypothetical protein